MAENLPAKTRNAVHSDANRSEETCSEVSDDRKPIFPESMALLSNVPESLPNSDSTPDRKDWFLYRPRTRSAKKKLLFPDVIVISSDSDGSDVEHTHHFNATEIVMKREKMSDDQPFEETAVSDVIFSDKSEVLGDQNIATVNCVEPLESHMECARDSHVTEIVMKKAVISDKSPLEETVVSAVATDVTDNSDLLEEQGIGTCSVEWSDLCDTYFTEIDTGNLENSDCPPSEVVVGSDVTDTDNPEMLKERGIATNNCIALQRSELECTMNSYVTEIQTEEMENSDDPSAVGSDVTDTDNPEMLNEQAIATNNCVALQRSNVDCSHNSNVTEMDTNEVVISNEHQLENGVVSGVTITDQPALLDEEDLAIDQPSKSLFPSVVDTSPFEMRQNLNASCSSTQPVTDNISQPKQNNLLPANPSNDNSTAVEDDSSDTGTTEMVIDYLDIWSEPNSSYGFSQFIERNSTGNQSTDVIGQSKRKDNLCECSTCENVISSVDDTTEVIIDEIRQLKPKRLQFKRECDSDSNSSKFIEGKGSSTGEYVVETTQNSMNDVNLTRTDLEDCSVQRLEWSSDNDVESNREIGDDAEDSFRNSSDSERMPEDQHAESNDSFMICKDEYDIYSTNDDSVQILNVETNQNKDDTESSEVVNSSDDALKAKLFQRTDNEYFEGRSMSDDELVKSGRYGVQVKNESLNHRAISSSALGKLNSMDEKMLRNCKNESSPIVEVADQTSKPLVSSNSQDEIFSAEEAPVRIGEYDREYGQRPPESDDKLLARIKRRRSAAKLICLAESAVKRKRIEPLTTTESDSDTGKMQRTKRTHPQPKKPSLKVIERMGGFFRKLSTNLRETRKKMKAKQSRKRKSISKVQNSTVDNFVVTPYREDKVVESMKGFVIVPDRR